VVVVVEVRVAAMMRGMDSEQRRHTIGGKCILEGAIRGIASNLEAARQRCWWNRE
jgi:hypothetical protein